MFSLPVPDFFQEEDEAALRLQADWLEQQLGLGNAFFARLLRLDEQTVRDRRLQGAAFPADRQQSLRFLWQTVLHLLSFLGFDEERVRHLLEQPIPVPAGAEANSLTPPWSGLSLRGYLEAQGPDGLRDVERWVTAFRFGAPYAA